METTKQTTYCILCSKNSTEKYCRKCIDEYCAFIHSGEFECLKTYKCCVCQKEVLHGFGEWSNPPQTIMTLEELADRSGWGDHFCVPCYEKK